MKLIAGLGNPGEKYRRTRHNIGYLVLSELAVRYAAGNRPKAKFHGDLLDIRDKQGNQVILLCPTTYMNESGTSVYEALRFYKIQFEDLLVVSDDLNLPFGQLRLRSEGSGGGQKGLADIIRKLGTEKFSRLRVGIGSPPGRIDAADYVLMNFTEKEQTELPFILKEAADAVECFLAFGITEAMNRFNKSKTKTE